MIWVGRRHSRNRRKRRVNQASSRRKLWPTAERAALAAFTSEQSRAAPGQGKAFYRAIPAGSPLYAVPRGQAFRMMRRCLVAKCFNGNNGDEEKPRTTLKCALNAE